MPNFNPLKAFYYIYTTLLLRRLLGSLPLLAKRMKVSHSGSLFCKSSLQRYNMSAKKNLVPHFITLMCLTKYLQYGKIINFLKVHDKFQKYKIFCMDKNTKSKFMLDWEGSVFRFLKDMLYILVQRAAYTRVPVFNIETAFFFSPSSFPSSQKELKKRAPNQLY